jgi:hypothetical protein
MGARGERVVQLDEPELLVVVHGIGDSGEVKRGGVELLDVVSGANTDESEEESFGENELPLEEELLLEEELPLVDEEVLGEEPSLG